jgi:hypothetical protein
MEPHSGEPASHQGIPSLLRRDISPPALGRRQGFAEHGSALPQPAGYAEPAVGSGLGGR